MVTDVRRAFRRAALPLGCYYAVTLLLPLANGAGQSDTFVSHAAAVIGVPLLIVVLLGTLGACAQRLSRSGRSA